jgi:cell division protein ZapD
MKEGSSQKGESAAAAADKPLVFEQPLNERMRSYLRIDFLYNQALFHAHSHSQWSSRAAVTSLLDLLAIVTRADMRADVLKELERQISMLTEYQRRPGVDVERLRSVIANLSRLRSDLLGAGSTFLQPLRDSAFLAAVRHRSSIPGGTCEFDLPDFYYWLSRTAETREEVLARWLAMLRPLCDAIGELLWLTRQGGKVRSEVASSGIFHITFERDSPVQLLRVMVASDLGVYPEISGSHYRSSVRFVVWNGLMERPRQTDTDVPFEIVCCT